MGSRASSHSLKTRPATHFDAAFLTQLRNVLAIYFISKEKASLDKTIELLDNPNSRTYVIESAGTRIGTFSLYGITKHTAEFGRMMILPRHYGSGVGKYIMEQATKEAKKLGINRLKLIVKETNTMAFKLYKECGFTVVSKQPIREFVVAMEAEVK